jgi:predicted solute-binding protein
VEDRHLPRIGCVKYLNARPLIYGWPGEVELDHPSSLCRRLAGGDLDVALVSSFEFLRNPIYRVVDGVSISSDGPVYSVVVAHRGELSDINEIELDPASETSVNLLRCLLAERGLNPDFVARSTSSDGARLLIGDQAIRFRETQSGFTFWDLGLAWKEMVDLPFVYALWLVRPEVADPKPMAERLRALRDENIGKIDKLIAQEKKFDAEFCRRYYRDNLRFNFGEREKEGLQAFANACAKHGLLPKRPLEFDLV